MFVTPEDINEPLVWHTFLRCIGFVILVNFAGLIPQVLPWCGSKGVYPYAVHHALRVKAFPSFLHRVAFFPCQLLPSTSDAALVATPCLGVVATGVFLVTLSPWALFTAQLLYMLSVEPNFMQWPWHSVQPECVWILLLHALASTEGFAAPHPLTTFALRCLVFRILFGFGKTKFSGSTRKDWLYIKPFMIVIPIASPIGVFLWRNAPTWFFYLSYFFFFLSEVVVPFAFFAPFPIRVVAGVFMFKLMIGIQLTGNFGTFNIVTAFLALPLFLPGGWSLSSCGDALLFVQMFMGMTTIIFNSWLQASWHQWPSFYRGGPMWVDFCTVLSKWHMIHPYGIFPPQILPAYRHIPVFELSKDSGKTWTPLRYRFQPSSAKERASFIPILHPILDFCIFYPVGWGGFMKSLFDCRSPCSNHNFRPIENIAKNLISDGAVVDLFAPGSREIVRGANMVRVVQHTLVPLARVGPEGEEWRVHVGHVEVPPSTAGDLAHVGPWLANLSETDPILTVWRQRSPLFMQSIAKVERFPRGQSGKSWLVEAARSPSHDKAATLYDTLMVTEPSTAYELLQQYRHCALAILHCIEVPLYFKVSPSPSAMTHFEIYLLALWALKEDTSDSVKILRAAAEGTWNRMEAENIFIFLNAMTVRMEASVWRRLKHVGAAAARDKSGDAYAPGFYTILDESWHRTVHYPTDQRAPESGVKFLWNEKTGLYDYVGTELINM